MTDILVPTLGESVTTATVARWLKAAGEPVAADEPVVELETDKVTVEVNASVAGMMEQHSVQEGTEVSVGTVIGSIAAGAAAAGTASAGASGSVSGALQSLPCRSPRQCGSIRNRAAPARMHRLRLPVPFRGLQRRPPTCTPITVAMRRCRRPPR